MLFRSGFSGGESPGGEGWTVGGEDWGEGVGEGEGEGFELGSEGSARVQRDGLGASREEAAGESALPEATTPQQ